MKKLFSLFLIAAFLFLSVNLFAQEKWNQGPEKMRMAGIGKSSSQGFIMPNYINPNTTPRIINSPSGINIINPNIRVHPNNLNYQSETYITRNPANPSILFGAANTYTVGDPGPYPNFFYSTGYYVSTNGGATWYGADTLNSNYGDPGPIFDKNGVMIMTYLGRPDGMKSSRSTDFGLSWGSAVSITPGSVDKNLANTDEAPSSAYYGRSYCVWSNFAATYPPIVVSYTTNSGQSWSAQLQINTPPSGHYSQGCDVAVNNAGVVYVTWAAPTSGGTYTEDYFGFAKSTNGGAAWTITENAFDGNGIRGTLSNKNALRVNSFPRIDVDKTSGKIYIVTSQKNLEPAGTDADIVIHSSTDGGTTWSAGVRVNQDAKNNGKTQWFPAVKVDEYGGVNVVYYDDRNVLTDSAEIYVSRSVNGGANWTDILVSDARSRILPLNEAGIAVGYGGDYIGITYANNKVYPMWMDRRTGVYQAFVTSIDLGPGITHTPLMNTELTTGPRAVNCIITPAGAPIVTSLTKLFVAKNAGAYDSVQLTNSGGTNWTGNIQLNGPGTYKYYIRTCDNTNRTAFAPGGAPANFYSFQAFPDTIKPILSHTPIGNVPRTIWPATITATATDNIGIDSVWVKWYKNNILTGIKEFKLLNTSGSTFSAAFNSVIGDVNINDSIFYRVIVQDSGSYHLKDSTALIQFKIIQLSNICIGTGTTPSNYPFTTYWDDGRTDLLYLASEITGGGGYAAFINKIAFNVISVGGIAMNGFNIKMQTTTATSLTAFTNTGWTVCYNGVHNVTSTGWDTIGLTTPFSWNGTSNLLVEICYNNTTYTTYSPVYASTTSANMMAAYSTDLISGDGCTAAWTATAYNYRPNTCFTITPLSGAGNNSSLIPGTYSLSQNYPNPFNPVTQVKYDLPKEGFVTLKVYDVLGREVSKLVNEVKTPGSYIVDFDGTSFSSGVYFYKLEVNGFSDVKRMMLIK